MTDHQRAGWFTLRNAAASVAAFDPELAATLRDMAAEYAGPYIEKDES